MNSPNLSAGTSRCVASQPGRASGVGQLCDGVEGARWHRPSFGPFVLPCPAEAAAAASGEEKSEEERNGGSHAVAPYRGCASEGASGGTRRVKWGQRVASRRATLGHPHHLNRNDSAGGESPRSGGYRI